MKDNTISSLKDSLLRAFYYGTLLKDNPSATAPSVRSLSDAVRSSLSLLTEESMSRESQSGISAALLHAMADAALDILSDAGKAVKEQPSGMNGSSYHDLVTYYNDKVIRELSDMPLCDTPSLQRRKLVSDFIAANGLDAAKRVIDKAVRSDFLNRTADIAPVSLEWLFTDDHPSKTASGWYDRRKSMQPEKKDIGDVIFENERLIRLNKRRRDYLIRIGEIKQDITIQNQ